MKHDALTMALLYDYYGELLTEKQRTCFDLYYNQDLSLSEIAEDLGVTRQGVHDTLARAEAQLRDPPVRGGPFPARGASLRSTWTAMEWIPPFPSAGRSHSPIR